MSDGIVRICNQHQLELRQIGPALVCPGGHSCPLEWHVKEDVPYVDPRNLKPVCPVHGCRLTGSGSTLDCQYGHKCTTRTLPRTEKPMAETVKDQKPKRGTVRPHGTHQRYFQEVKSGAAPCDPCRKAANEYGKARRLARLAAAGETKRSKRETKAPKTETVPAKRETKSRALVVRAKASRPRAVVAIVVPRAAGADLEGKVLRLRAELAEAEQAYLAHVRKLLPGLV